MNQMDSAINEIKKIKKIDNVILSWSYGDDGTGVVIMGRKDPTSINENMEILGAWSDEDGLNRLKNLGIDIF